MRYALFNDAAFEFIKGFLLAVEIFFALYLIGYSTFLFIAVVTGSSSLFKKRQQDMLKNTILKDHYVPISIIVPAFNEDVTIVENVRSLLTLDYPLYEIVVVDDGSSDKTSAKLIEAFDMLPIRRPIQRKINCQPVEFVYEAATFKVPLTLIRKKNGGKADSLNMGINACKYPYFICIDADSVLQYDSLSKIVKPVLEDENVVAVGGAVRPSNSVEIKDGRVINYRLPRNLLACMQVLEYDRSFLASRILFDKFNGSLIISGAFGLFKKDTVVAAGGYDASTMGEDMELVVKLHDYCVTNDIPYLIRYATDAICWSQVPENLKDLSKQRRRWHIGLFQSMWKHRVMLANPKFGLTSFISYFYFLIYELLSPFIEVFGITTMVLAFFVDLINVPFMLIFFGIYALFGSVMSMTAFFARTQTIDLKVTFRDVLKALLLCTVEISVLRFIMAWVRATAFIGYKKKKLEWGSIKRQKINLK
nr:glycosyltransferase [uncultured Ruminococcus sp.]